MRNGGLFGGAALAVVFVLPTVALQGGAADSLADTLRRTLDALDALTGIEQRVAAREPGAVVSVLAATEPALPLELRSDDSLVALRGDVSRLERELDSLHSGAATHLPGHVGVPLDLDGELGPAAVATTGLDEATRQMLGALRPGGSTADSPAAANALPLAQPAAPQSSAAKQAFEPTGYAADALRLARAYYKQARWSEALALLEGRAGTAESYWRARCLDKLGRSDEALRVYEAVVADPTAGEEAARAREDLEFLRWRMEFDARQKTVTGKEPR